MFTSVEVRDSEDSEDSDLEGQGLRGHSLSDRHTRNFHIFDDSSISSVPSVPSQHATIERVSAMENKGTKHLGKQQKLQGTRTLRRFMERWATTKFRKPRHTFGCVGQVGKVLEKRRPIRGLRLWRTYRLTHVHCKTCLCTRIQALGFKVLIALDQIVAGPSKIGGN